nr:S26 family signal peptidase [Halorubrum sp. JWXQ-INN 858]
MARAVRRLRRVGRSCPRVGRPLVAIVAIAALLVLLAGAWPPLVAVESGSMAPSVERGDLVVVTAIDRFPWGPIAGERERAGEPSGGPDAGRTTAGDGDVVVFSRPGDDGRPILHRVAFAVEAGEDWTRRGDPDRIDGDCAALRHCPAPHDGYVTYGDANAEYDQSAGIAPVVRPEWIHARALTAVPALGWPRIVLDLAVARFGVGAAVVLAGLVATAGGVASLAVGRVRDRI